MDEELSPEGALMHWYGGGDGCKEMKGADQQFI